MNKSSFSLSNKSSIFFSGIFAIGIYIFLIGILFFYFNTRDEKKPVHYVKKNEDRIRVTMAAPKNKTKSTTKPSVKKKTPPKKRIEKKEIKKNKPKESVKKQKDTRKKVIKEKIVKKAKVKQKPKKVVKKPPPKKVNKPKDLFANVSSSKKPPKNNIIKVSSKPIKTKQNNLIKVSNKPSASDLVSSTLKVQKKSDKGISNAYLALIEEKLKGWPAQSDYAGELVKVWIKVQPSGDFVFKVITASSNDAFNKGLIAYLEQLQEMGFGRHKGSRAYELDVEFIAKE